MGAITNFSALAMAGDDMGHPKIELADLAQVQASLSSLERFIGSGTSTSIFCPIHVGPILLLTAILDTTFMAGRPGLSDDVHACTSTHVLLVLPGLC